MARAEWNSGIIGFQNSLVHDHPVVFALCLSHHFSFHCSSDIMSHDGGFVGGAFFHKLPDFLLQCLSVQSPGHSESGRETSDFNNVFLKEYTHISDYGARIRDSLVLP